MAEHRTQALVLRSFDHAESDRVVHLYTEQLGRVSAIAKGARRSRRRFPGALEQLSVSDVRIVSSSRTSLLRLESARIVESYEALVAPLERFAVACQLAEILDRLTADGDANPRLYQFAVGVLGVLREEEPDLLLSVLVVIKTLAWLGYEPRLERCVVCDRGLPERAPVGFDPRQGGAVCQRCRAEHDAPLDPALLRALAAGIRSPLRTRHALGLDPAAVRTLSRMVEQFSHFQVGVELRSTRFLQQIARFAQLDAPQDRGDTPREPSASGTASTALREKV